jgi:hypothetical protein
LTTQAPQASKQKIVVTQTQLTRAGGADFELCKWNIETLKCEGVMKAHRSGIICMCLGHEDGIIITGEAAMHARMRMAVFTTKHTHARARAHFKAHAWTRVFSFQHVVWLADADLHP